METPIKQNDVRNALFFIGNFYQAGIQPSDALKEMVHLQPKYADFWKKAAAQAANGHALSECLKPILNTSNYSAFQAAENAGNLTEVLAALEEAYLTNDTVKKSLRTLLYPFAMLFVGIGAFLFFSVVVIPSIADAIPNTNNNHDPMLQFSMMLHGLFTEYGTTIGIIVAITITGIVLWLRDPAKRDIILARLSTVPFFGNAMTDLFFGQWAVHMALITKSGIVIQDALRLTTNILPLYLQIAINRIANDVVQRGLTNASDPKMQANDDPRQIIPHLIASAFRVSELTGEADKHFLSTGNALIKQSTRRIMIFSATAEKIIIPLSAIIIASSILPYFTQLGSALGNVH